MKQGELVFNSRDMFLKFFHEFVACYAFAEAGEHTVVACYGTENFVHVEVVNCIADSICVARESFDNDNVSRKINAYITTK